MNISSKYAEESLITSCKTEKSSIPKMSVWMKRGVRWTVGLVVLYFVFTNINFAKFKTSVVGVNPWLLVIGLAHSPLLVVIPAARWLYLLRQYYGNHASPSFAFNRYWSGLALGFFTPASIGLDAYRIVSSSRKFGDFSGNTFIILLEKFLALLTCTSIISILYPVVSADLSIEIRRVFYLSYTLLFGCVLLILLIYLVLRTRLRLTIVGRVNSYVRLLAQKTFKRIGVADKGTFPEFSFLEMVKPLAAFRIIGVVLLSFGIQLVSSVKSQIFFCSLGYQIPFVVNLFAAPVLYFIFLLPISFGSIGIREGIYVLLYGLFGVPAEIALLVSFFNLSGMLLNNLIGGLVLIFSNTKAGCEQ